MSSFAPTRSARLALVALFAALVLLVGASHATAAPFGATGLTVDPTTKQAGGHPTLKQKLTFNAAQAGSDDLKSIQIAHAPGMLQNLTLPKCISTGTGSANKYRSDACPSNSLVGTVSVKWRSSFGTTQTTNGSAYLLSQASSGAAGTIGVILRPSSSHPVFISVDVLWPSTSPLAPRGPVLKVVDIPNSFNLKLGNTSYPITVSEVNLDLAARGGGGSSGPYFTLNPSSCTPAASTATVTAWSGNTSSVTSSFTPTGCSSQTLASTVSLTRTTSQLGAPTGLTFGINTPTADLATQRAQIRNAQLRVTGSELVTDGSPATCSLDNVISGACSAASIVGTAEAGIPFLGVAPTADVHLVAAPPSARLAAALPGPGGSKFTILWSAANTGTTPVLQINADNIPQLFSSSVKLTLNPGLVKNSITCSVPSAQATLTSWFGSAATFNPPLGMAQTPCFIDTNLTANIGGDRSATFAFSSPTAGATFECRLDGAAYAPCQSPLVLTNLSFGSHGFCVRAVLGYLVDQTPACNSFAIDPVPPTVLITSPANGTSTVNPQVNVSFTVNGGASIPAEHTCAVNGVATGSATTNSVSLAQGPNLVTVTCSVLGFIGSSTVTVLRVAPPSVTITSPSTDPSFTTAASINLAYTYNGSSSIPAGTACFISGPSFSQPSTTPANNSVPIIPGTNLITITCENEFGAFSDSVTVLQADPVTTANCTRNGTTAECTFQTSPSIPQTVFTCSLDGAAPASCVSPVTYNGLTPGTHTFQVCAVNPFGAFCSTTTIPPTLLAPAPMITSPPNNFATAASSMNVVYALDGAPSIPPGTTCTVSNLVTGVSNPSTSTTNNPVNLASGTNLIRVSCSNLAGTGESNVVVYSSGPEPPVFNANCTRSGSTVICTFSVSGGSGPVSFTCSVNGSPFATCFSPATFVVGPGPATITICVTTTVGTQCRTITLPGVDPPPAVFITSPAADPSYTSQTAANVAFTVNGSTSIPSGTTCTISDAAGTRTTTSTTTNSASLNVGSNLVTIACSNASGSNSDSTTIVRGNPPVVQIIDPPDPFTTPATSINVRYLVNGSTVIPAGTTCAVNGQPSTDTQNNIVPVTPGSFTIVVICTNQFGAGSDTATKVSVPPPGVTITSPTDGTVTFAPFTNVTFTVNGAPSIPVGTTCTVNGAATNSATNNSVALALGPNTIVVTCFNAFGGGSDTNTLVRVAEPPPPPSCSVEGDTLGCNLPAAEGYSYNCQLDNETATACSGTWIRGGLDNGPHQARICSSSAGSTNCAVYQFVVQAAAVTIVSPSPGSTTTDTGVVLTYTMSGFPADSTCSPASGSRIPLTIGSNTINVYCSLPSGEQSASLASTTVTRNPLPSFAPMFDQSYDTDIPSGGIVLGIDIHNPAGSNPVRTATIDQPGAVYPNFIAHGPSDAKCPASTIVNLPTPTFAKHNCPDFAKVGTVTLSSPDFPSPLGGEVWMVNRGGLPWFGVDFTSASLGNDASMRLPNMVIGLLNVQDDPDCDIETEPDGICESHLRFTVFGLPDAAALSAQIRIGSHSYRSHPSVGPLPGELFRWEVSACDTINARASLTSVNNESATVNEPIFLPPVC